MQLRSPHYIPFSCGRLNLTETVMTLTLQIHLTNLQRISRAHLTMVSVDKGN